MQDEQQEGPGTKYEAKQESEIRRRPAAEEMKEVQNGRRAGGIWVLSRRPGFMRRPDEWPYWVCKYGRLAGRTQELINELCLHWAEQDGRLRGCAT
jgi:hypothetical protein